MIILIVIIVQPYFSNNALGVQPEGSYSRLQCASVSNLPTRALCLCKGQKLHILPRKVCLKCQLSPL